ncbi:hypothetical protein PG995_011695 [Apiospora arundinis]
MSMDQPESASNADIVTPTVRSFRDSIIRSSTNASNQSYAARSIRRQQESSSSISEDTSPSGSANSSTSGSNPSPGSDQRELSEPFCEVCNFTPTGILKKSGTYLQKHRKTHLNERFPCEYCDKSYSRKDNLVNHVKKCHGFLALSSGKDMTCLEEETAIKPAPLRVSKFYEDFSDFTDQGGWEAPCN